MWRVSLFVLLFLCVSVGGGFLEVFVNRLKLANVELSITNNINYLYAEGDKIDVWCVRNLYNYNLMLTHDYIDQRIGTRPIIKTSTAAQYQSGIGLRTTLKAEHNRTIIACKGFQDSSYSIITITLILQNKFEDLINVKINNYTLRNQNPPNGYNVHFLQGERLKFESKTIKDDIVLETHRYEFGRIDNPTTEMTFEMIPNYKYLLEYNAKSRNGTSLSILEVHFFEFYSQLIDPMQLTINISNSLLEVYQLNDHQDIYYEYEEGECLTLKCTLRQNPFSAYGYSLNFSGKVGNKSSIIKHIQLSAKDDNTTLECLLNYWKKTVRRIRVIFHMKTTTDSVFPYWIPVAVCGVICIVAGFTIVVCCVKKRNGCMQRQPARENFVNQLYANENPEIPIPSHHPHSDLVYRRNDDNYGEIIVSGFNPSRTQAFRSQARTSDLNYADLDMKPSGEGLYICESNDSPYANVAYNVRAHLRPRVAHK